MMVLPFKALLIFSNDFIDRILIVFMQILNESLSLYIGMSWVTLRPIQVGFDEFIQVLNLSFVDLQRS